MNIIVAGGDGFCGWPTALYLSAKGHRVAIVDNLVRRDIDVELGSNSLTPITSLAERLAIWKEISKQQMVSCFGDLNDYEFLSQVMQTFQPDAFVHFAEQRSAPYSMIDRAHAYYTQKNNVLGTLNVLYAIHEFVPNCHLVKLGSMGEYGAPNIDIEEGYLEVTHKGRSERILYPKKPMSFYHLSKVHDSNNIYFSSHIWGLRATDLNQGIVYGYQTNETRQHPGLVNRFDYDGIYGTALNRFIVQAACDMPLSVYGKGGQTRGFINLMDTVRCIELAVQHPAEPGEMRIYNQFTESFSVLELAERVRNVALQMGIKAQVAHVANPRVEAEEHYFHAAHTKLESLGLMPTPLTDELIAEAIGAVKTHRHRVIEKIVMNSPDWRK